MAIVDNLLVFTGYTHHFSQDRQPYSALCLTPVGTSSRQYEQNTNAF